MKLVRKRESSLYVPETLEGIRDAEKLRRVGPSLEESDAKVMTGASEEEAREMQELCQFLIYEVLPKCPIDVREAWEMGLWQFDFSAGCLAFQFFEDAPKEGIRRVTYYVHEVIRQTPNKFIEVVGYESLH